MNIKQCESFIKLAKTQNFSKAAQELFISKQGLSRSIQSLEDELGAVLFIRTIHGTELSDVGKSIFPEMAAIVKKYRQIQNKLTLPAGEELRILFSFGFFTCVSPELVFSFFNENRTIKFYYKSCNDSEIEQKLISEEFDLAFCSNSVHLEQFNYFKLFKNYHCFVVHKDHPLAQKKFVEMEDLKDLQIAISAPEEYNDYTYLSKKFKEKGIGKVNIFPCYESSMLYQFAEEKRGVSFMVTNLSQTCPSSSTRYLFFRDFEDSAYDINIITPKSKKMTKTMADFISHSQKYCEKQLRKRRGFPADMDYVRNESMQPDSLARLPALRDEVTETPWKI